MEDLKWLEAAEWRSFDRYPPQGEEIYLRCECEKLGEDKQVKYFKISRFNAVTFKPKEIAPDLSMDCNWSFKWIGPQEIEGARLKALIQQDDIKVTS